ncbi:MAG: hypothetical protein ACOY8P_09550 [Thermodesulfobacteriota bacterium]
MPDKPPVIILIISKSFGEADWILPVLAAFKEQHPEWRIITLFGHKLIHDFLVLNRTLYAEFRKYSSLNIVPQEIPSLFRDTIDPEQVKIILKDYNEDQYCPFKAEVAGHCPRALVVSYPHSNHIFSNRASDALQRCPDPDAYSVHDIFLLCSEHDMPYWSGYVDLAKIRTFGYPRYDSGWIRRMRDAPGLSETEEYRRAQLAGKVFFYISRGAHPVYLSPPDYEYLLRSTVEEALRYEDAFLLIKAHPRQDMEELNRILSEYDRSRWLVSGLHLAQLCSLADVVISGWSSGILDGLAAGKPVIEFWRFSGHDPDCRMLPDGRPTTIYRELDLVRAAETREELRTLLDSALAEPDAPAWLAQRAAFQRHCRQTDTAALDVARCLFDEAAHKEQAVERHHAGSPAGAVVTAMVDHITLLAEQGREKQVEEWISFLRGQFPDDPQVLNNLGVFLFNRGEFDNAVAQLTRSFQAAPALETAVNLAHILLLLGRKTEATDVVVAFLKQAPGSGQRAAFLQALSEQAGPESLALLQEGAAAIRSGG